MRQKAVVDSVTDEKRALVRVERASMCDGCHKKRCGDSCAIYSVFGGDRSFSAVSQNDLGAMPGDTVIVETADRSVLFSSFIVFILPLVLMFAIYAVGARFLSERGSVLLAFAAFALYFAVITVVEKLRKPKNKPKLKIVQIIRTAQTNQTADYTHN